jgi:hypothetical protein
MSHHHWHRGSLSSSLMDGEREAGAHVAPKPGSGVFFLTAGAAVRRALLDWRYLRCGVGLSHHPLRHSGGRAHELIE